MGYHIRRHESVQDALRRVAAEQLEMAIREIRDETMDRHDVVHLLRKRCKKLRGLLRLVRLVLNDVFDDENAFFRDLSRELSFVRDSQALVEAFDRLLVHFRDSVKPEPLEPIRERLIQTRRDVAGEHDDLSLRLVPVLEKLELAKRRVTIWTIQKEGFEAVEPGLMKTYRRARRAMRRADKQPTSEQFHEWRKRVKYHWHHARLLRNISPRLIRPHRRMANELAELLGQDHDLAVLRQKIVEAPETFGPPPQQQMALALIAQRQDELQTQAKRLGERLLAEKPRRLADRWRVYWQTWQTEPDEADKPQPLAGTTVPSGATSSMQMGK